MYEELHNEYALSHFSYHEVMESVIAEQCRVRGRGGKIT